MTEAPARGVRLSRSARRAQLLVAARDVFAAQGYHAAAMDDIAERAGVSKPVLYQHFSRQAGALPGAAHDLRGRPGGAGPRRDRRHVGQPGAGRGGGVGILRLRRRRRAGLPAGVRVDVRGEPEAAAVVDGALTRCIDTVAAAVTTDAGLDAPRARLLAVGLVGLSQVAAQYWLDSEQEVLRDEAVALMASLGGAALRASRWCTSAHDHRPVDGLGLVDRTRSTSYEPRPKPTRRSAGAIST